jgi:putative permease
MKRMASIFTSSKKSRAQVDAIHEPMGQTMLNVLKGWVHRFLSEEEALLFSFLLTIMIILILTMGDTLAPLLAGIVLAFLMQGVINLLLERNVPNRLAIILTFMVFMGGFLALLFFVIPLVWGQMAKLFNELPRMVDRGQALLELIPQNYPNLVSEAQISSLIDLAGAGAARSGQWLLSFSLSQVPVIISMLIYLVLVPILVFFFLKDKDLILSWLKSMLPEKRPLMDRIGEEMSVQMANYVRGKVIEMLITGVVTYVLFQSFGMKYAALLAFFVGLSVIVPYIGIAIVSIPVLLIAYFQWGFSSVFVVVMIGYTIIQTLDGTVLVPLLFSEVVNLHPVIIIAAVLFFGGLWGLWGVFFAIPLATLVKSIMHAWPQSSVTTPGD